MSDQSDGSESTMSWKVSASGMMGRSVSIVSEATPTSPDADELLREARGMSIDGLLALLEQLDGAPERAGGGGGPAAGGARGRGGGPGERGGARRARGGRAGGGRDRGAAARGRAPPDAQPPVLR